MKKYILSIVMLASTTTLYATKDISPRVNFVKQSLDNKLLKIEEYAKVGKAKKFPYCCASTDSSLLKYTFPNAPQELKEYYDNAKNICYGRLHILALENKLNTDEKTDCKKIEVTLQINHIKSYLKKSKDMIIWEDFMKKYKDACPDNLNF